MNNREKNYYLELHREKMIFIPVSNLKFTKNLYRGMTDLIEIRGNKSFGKGIKKEFNFERSFLKFIAPTRTKKLSLQ